MKKSVQKEQGTDTTRRDFLKKAGKTAVLTPPAMVLLSKPSSAEIKASLGPVKDSQHDYSDQPISIDRLWTLLR